MTTGINGGERPYRRFNEWIGQFEGRYYLHVKHTTRSDETPPPAVTDLKATRPVASSLKLQWTAPSDAARYRIVWSTKPITEAHSTDPSVMNWWAANAVGPDLMPVPGTTQTLTIPVGNAKTLYAALFTFDENDNMSRMSNVATVSLP